jgi:hypothetical protein
MARYIAVYLEGVQIARVGKVKTEPCVDHEVTIARLTKENVELLRVGRELNDKWYEATKRVEHLEKVIEKLTEKARERARKAVP